MKDRNCFSVKFVDMHTYFQKHNLDKHIMGVHEGEKPFKCELCEYTSTNKQHLSQHFQAVHEGKIPSHCQCCGSWKYGIWFAN